MSGLRRRRGNNIRFLGTSSCQDKGDYDGGKRLDSHTKPLEERNAIELSIAQFALQALYNSR